MSDLRGFLERVKKERPTDLLEIEREIDPRFETIAADGFAAEAAASSGP